MGKIKVYPLSVENEALIKEIDIFRAKAGFPSPALDYAENEMNLNDLLIKRPSSTFMVEADGDSMTPVVPDRAKLIVDRSMQAKNNDIVLAAVNGEFNVKYFQQKGDRKWLVAANPLYKPVEIVDGMEFSIFGVVAWVLIETRLCNNVRTR